LELDSPQADGLYELIHDLDQDGDLTMDELIRRQKSIFIQQIYGWWLMVVNGG
jgi:hypothetical protein